MRYHFEIIKGKRDRFWTRIKSANRKIVWVSEMYKTKQNAETPVLKLIKIIGKKNCSMTFIDETKG